MSSVQAESVIKSIIREIGTECSSRGVEASETLIAFTVKAAVLDPDNAFNVERALTKTDVQQLIQVIICHAFIINVVSVVSRTYARILSIHLHLLLFMNSSSLV